MSKDILKTVVEIRRHDGTVQALNVEELLKMHKDKAKLHTFRQQEDDVDYYCPDCEEHIDFCECQLIDDEEECQCQTCTCQDDESVKEEYNGYYVEYYENGDFDYSETFEDEFDKKKFMEQNLKLLSKGQSVKVWKLGKSDLSFGK